MHLQETFPHTRPGECDRSRGCTRSPGTGRRTPPPNAERSPMSPGRVVRSLHISQEVGAALMSPRRSEAPPCLPGHPLFACPEVARVSPCLQAAVGSRSRFLTGPTKARSQDSTAFAAAATPIHRVTRGRPLVQWTVGLSRRRSRVRVPSLPSLRCACKWACCVVRSGGKGRFHGPIVAHCLVRKRPANRVLYDRACSRSHEQERVSGASRRSFGRGSSPLWSIRLMSN